MQPRPVPWPDRSPPTIAPSCEIDLRRDAPRHACHGKGATQHRRGLPRRSCWYELCVPRHQTSWHETEPTRPRRLFSYSRCCPLDPADGMQASRNPLRPRPMAAITTCAACAEPSTNVAAQILPTVVWTCGPPAKIVLVFVGCFATLPPCQSTGLSGCRAVGLSGSQAVSKHARSSCQTGACGASCQAIWADRRGGELFPDLIWKTYDFQVAYDKSQRLALWSRFPLLFVPC